jgi:DNA-binding CsgD family transcriptional regulator
MERKHADGLTERQKECLLLVYSHHTITEIAGKLGLSVEGVNYHLGGARKALGASSSAQAARLLYGGLPPTDYISHVAASNAVGATTQSDSFGTSPDQQASPLMVREDRAIFQPTLEQFDQSEPSLETMQGWERPASILGRIANRTSQIAGIVLMLLALTYAVTIWVRWYEANHHITPK